jgi:hypothetical protein
MFGGLLRRVACRLRPYECQAGDVDQVLEVSLEILYEAFMGRIKKQDALEAVLERFEKIPVAKTERPKVAIFGDLYSRDNRVMNQDLIRFIERHGGEVVTTPYSDYARMIANPYFRKWFYERKFLTLISSKALMTTITRLERTYYRMFEPLLGEPMATFDDPPEAILAQYGVRIEHTGESLDNLLKVHYIKKHHPGCDPVRPGQPGLLLPVPGHGSHGPPHRGGHRGAGGPHHLRRHRRAEERHHYSLPEISPGRGDVFPADHGSRGIARIIFRWNFDELANRRKESRFVIPLQAGIQSF